MEYQTLRLDIENRIARIVLARGDDGNRIDLRLLRELAEACEAIDRDSGVWLAVVTADGPDFCVGWADETRESLRSSTDYLDPFGCMARLPVPVLVALHGRAESAGLELALACDLRVARDDARFSFPDVGQGAVPVAGGTVRLPRVVGRTVASAMLLLGDELDASAAYGCGLISRIFPAAGFEAQVETLTGRMLANGPIALRYAKELVHNGIELPLDHALRYELDLSIILQTTRDRVEGVQAFLDKRQPGFEGR